MFVDYLLFLIKQFFDQLIEKLIRNLKHSRICQVQAYSE